MNRFTIEEINLMCIYDTSTRANLLVDLSDALPDIYDPELLEITENVISKLNLLSDEDYIILLPELIPADESEE